MGASSVGAVLREPVVQAAAYPLPTFVGTQYRPAVSVDRGCERCPYLEPCRRDVVERDGFAWCEQLIAVDLDIEHHTVNRDVWDSDDYDCEEEELCPVG